LKGSLAPTPLGISSMSLDDRRITFRAPRAAVRPATLWVGRRSWRVHIVEESAGGLCVVAEPALLPPLGVAAELETDDGECIGVQIIRLQALEGSLRIGLKRETFRPPVVRRSMRPLSPFLVLVGLTIGLYAGFAANTDSLRECLSQIPVISRVLYR
jgi:hypothetical protein